MGFGGVVQVKDPFDLPLDEREARNHLLLVNVTVVFDPKITVKDLLDEPATKELLAELRDTTDGESKDKHQRLFDEAVEILRLPSLAAVPVKICGEVQITLTEIGKVRDAAHGMYDGRRAVDCQALYDAFGAAVEEVVAKSLRGASEEGQLSAAMRLVAEEGADVN